MTWLVIACSIATAYLSGAAVIAVLARLAALPWGIAVLAGIAWGPVMAWVVVSALPWGTMWQRLKCWWYGSHAVSYYCFFQCTLCGARRRH